MINNKLSLYCVWQTDWEMHSQYIVKGNLQRNIITSTPISLRRQLVPLNLIKSGTQMHRGTEVGRCNIIFIWSQNTEVLIYTVNNTQMLTTSDCYYSQNTHTLTVWAQPSRNVHIPDVSCNFHTLIFASRYCTCWTRVCWRWEDVLHTLGSTCIWF